MSRLLFGRGAKGSLVAELQAGLLCHGFDPQGLDGVFGRDTVHAVEAFQRDAGTPVTGSVSDEEWVTLTERGVPSIEARALLCFDAQVQNGGVKEPIQAALVAMAAAPELERLEALAAGVANTARPEFRRDVLARKMTLARGDGVVHGRRVYPANWGIALVPAFEGTGHSTRPGDPAGSC